MCLKLEAMEPVPEETARLAHIVCPKGNLCIWMSDELGEVFQEALFVALYPRRGQPAEAPWRLAMVTVLQFGENSMDCLYRLTRFITIFHERSIRQYLYGASLENGQI